MTLTTNTEPARHAEKSTKIASVIPQRPERSVSSCQSCNCWMAANWWAHERHSGLWKVYEVITLVGIIVSAAGVELREFSLLILVVKLKMGRQATTANNENRMGHYGQY